MPREDNLARNRYGWQKRAKEMARKQKNEDKMKRRQGKAPLAEVLEMPGDDSGERPAPPESDLRPL